MDLWENVKQVYGSHFMRSFHTLVKSSLPVFVAASLSRAALALIFLIPSKLPPIAAAFLYALFCCHSIGTYIAISLETSSPMHKYYISLATETSGFAWKESVILILFNQHGDKIMIIRAILIWIGAVATVVAAVCISAYIAHVAVKLSVRTEKYLSKFRSEVFSLSIAYPFTLLVAYGIYWKQRDDSSVYAADDADDSIDDDNVSDTTKVVSHLLFFGYAVALTYIAAILQSYDSIIYGDIFQEEEEEEVGGSFSGGGDECSTMRVLNGNPKDKVMLNKEFDEDWKDCRLDDLSRTRSSSVRWDEHDDDSRGVLSTHFKTHHSILEALYRQLFSWDTRFLLIDSLRTLLATTQGYMVGSAWYIWSTHTFESVVSLSFRYRIIGWVGFALVMTVLMTLMMSRSTHKLSSGLLPVSEGGLAATRRSIVRRRKRQQVKVAASRITVGWIWEEVVHAIFVELQYTANENSGGRWTSAAVKCVIALLVAGIGYGVHYFSNSATKTHCDPSQLDSVVNLSQSKLTKENNTFNERLLSSSTGQ